MGLLQDVYVKTDTKPIGDAITKAMSEKKGRWVLKQGHYCEKCYKSLMKKGIE